MPQLDLFGGPAITAVASYSGGVSSWAAAKRYAEKHGTGGLVLLFADTLAGHPTTYRFLIQGAANIYGLTETCSEMAWICRRSTLLRRHDQGRGLSRWTRHRRVRLCHRLTQPCSPSPPQDAQGGV